MCPKLVVFFFLIFSRISYIILINYLTCYSLYVTNNWISEIYFLLQWLSFPSDSSVIVKNRFFQFHFYLVPLQPEQITASNVQSSSLTLAWTLPDPSPGNTTYTIYIYEGIDDNGTSFLMKESIKVYGVYQCLVFHFIICFKKIFVGN